MSAVRAPINWLCFWCETIAITHLLVWAWERRRNWGKWLSGGAWEVEKMTEDQCGNEWREWQWKRRGREVRDRTADVSLQTENSGHLSKIFSRADNSSYCCSSHTHILMRNNDNQMTVEYWLYFIIWRTVILARWRASSALTVTHCSGCEETGGGSCT